MAITFLSAKKPGVYVNQFVTGPTVVTPAESDLPALIIGPKVNLVRNKLAGVYEGQEVEVPFPEYEAGSKVFKDSVRIVLQNIIMAITESENNTVVDGSASGTGRTLSGTILTDKKQDLSSALVGDSVTISYTISSILYSIKANVVEVNPVISPAFNQAVLAPAGETLKIKTSAHDPSAVSVPVTIYFINGSDLPDSEVITLDNTDTSTPIAGLETCKKILSVDVGAAISTVSLIVTDSADNTIVTIPTPGAQTYVSALTRLTLDKALPSMTSGITYIVTRNTGKFEAFGNILKTDTVNGFSNVFPGYEIKVDHPTQGLISAKVNKVIDVDEIQLNKSFAAATNVGYEITQKNSNRTSVMGIRAGLFATANTDILQDASNTGFTTVKVGDDVRIQNGQVIQQATVLSKIDNYRIQLSKKFDAGSIYFSITRQQVSNSPIELFDKVNQFVLNNANSDKYVDDNTFTIKDALQVSGLDGDISIKQADIYVDYDALSVAKANTVIEVETDLVIEDRVGLMNDKNPLGLAVGIACANTIAKVYAIPIDDTTNAAWLRALSIAENQKAYNICLLTQSGTIQSYGRTHVDGMSTANKHGWRVLWMNLEHPYEETLITTTPNGTITYKTNSTPLDLTDDYIEFYDPLGDYSSVPASDTYIAFWENGELFDINDNPIDPVFLKVSEKGEDSNVLICETIEYLGTQGKGLYIPNKKVSLNAIPVGPGLATYDYQNKTFTIPDSIWQTAFGTGTFATADRVVVNAQVDEDQEGIFTVSQVGSASPAVDWIIKKDSTISEIDVNDLVNLPTSAAPNKVGSYKIIKLNNLTEQAQALANIANSFSSRRVLYITNETCIVEVDNVDKELPGYYICAAYAGLSSGTMPHQPMTEFEINAIKGIRKGNPYFDLDQQGIVVAGGGWIMIQDVPDKSLPKAWKQTTTDTTSIKTIEFSFTKNLDDICYKLFEDHKRFPGTSNNLPIAREDAASQTEVTLNELKKDRGRGPNNGYVGPQVVSATFNGFVPDPILADTSYADIDLQLPLVWNVYVFNVRA